MFIIISAVAAPAFQAVAYLPHYRLDPLPGAENALGRPSWDAAPGSWDGRIAANGMSMLPVRWSDGSWSQRLMMNFDVFILHLPMDDDFLSGKSPDPRHLAYLKNLGMGIGKEIRISLIGDSDDFMPVAADESSRIHFARRLASLCRSENLDGIDLDWEFPATPRDEEKAALTELTRVVRDQLPEETILSAAVSRWRLPDAEFFSLLDHVHLMAYDGYGRHATYEGALADSEILLARLNIPHSKLVLGIPFYGRIFSPDSEEYWSGTRNYRDIVEEFQPAPDSDEEGGYFFNGPDTVAKKAHWAAENNLGGVFAWEPFYDTVGEMSLSQAIRDATE